MCQAVSENYFNRVRCANNYLIIFPILVKASRGATIWRDFIVISGTRRFKVVKKRKTYVVRRKARKSGRGDSAAPPL